MSMLVLVIIQIIIFYLSHRKILIEGIVGVVKG